MTLSTEKLVRKVVWVIVTAWKMLAVFQFWLSAPPSYSYPFGPGTARWWGCQKEEWKGLQASSCRKSQTHSGLDRRRVSVQFLLESPTCWTSHSPPGWCGDVSWVQGLSRNSLRRSGAGLPFPAAWTWSGWPGVRPPCGNLWRNCSSCQRRDTE